MNAGRSRKPERGSIPSLSTEILQVCEVEMHHMRAGKSSLERCDCGNRHAIEPVDLK
jgi:hypothetical protein